MSIFRGKGTVSTTDATATVLESCALQDNKTYFLWMKVAAHCTGGAGGNAGAAASYDYRASFKRAGAGPVLVGAVLPLDFEEAGIAATWVVGYVINGNNIEFQVVGGATDNIDWTGYCEFIESE